MSRLLLIAVLSLALLATPGLAAGKKTMKSVDTPARVEERHERGCNTKGDFVFTIAESRDKGVLLTELFAGWRTLPQKRGSYGYPKKMAIAVYGLPSLTPTELRVLCQKGLPF